jgi:hypothetical protein
VALWKNTVFRSANTRKTTVFQCRNFPDLNQRAAVRPPCKPGRARRGPSSRSPGRWGLLLGSAFDPSCPNLNPPVMAYFRGLWPRVNGRAV